MSDFVPKALEQAASLYRGRNALYGDNYKNFGKLVEVLFPEGIPSGPMESMISYHNRTGVLFMVLSKLSRYCANFGDGGHSDSLDDLAVYAMMLNELDEEIRAEQKYHESQNTNQVEGQTYSAGQNTTQGGGIDPE